ncbi:lipoyl synthase, partial [Mycobacterium sp. CVI_P3]|nr:lipoyl synthase [Mycobacterium pinniadriaticum]MCX2940491.1 lipoyl synthase [Mycobacterium pinniadriaticum]
ELANYAERLGFAGVLSGPLVRSSYRAGRLYQQAAAAQKSDPAPKPIS